jgi:hypothetical protein
MMIAHPCGNPIAMNLPPPPTAISSDVDLPIYELDGAEWGTLHREIIFVVSAPGNNRKDVKIYKH